MNAHGASNRFDKCADARLGLLLLAFFQQHSQFSECLAIFWSPCGFLDANQRGKIDAFEADTESSTSNECDKSVW